jgi:hypothetical protein
MGSHVSGCQAANRLIETVAAIRQSAAIRSLGNDLSRVIAASVCDHRLSYQHARVDRLLAGLADGLPIKSACITAGIGVSTLSDWREKYPEQRPPLTLPEPGAKLQTNIGVPNGIFAGNDTPPDSRPGSPWSMPARAKAPSDASPVFQAWLEHERPEPET